MQLVLPLGLLQKKSTNRFWPELELETWDEVVKRTALTTQHLIEQCYGKGDLIIYSHRSTLQSVMAHIVPDWEGDTKLDYSAIAMFVEDIRERGKWQVQTFNEVRHMEFQLKSPASNPFRHIEGYYEDLSWDNYKSTAARVSGPPEAEVEKEKEKKVIPPRAVFYSTQLPAMLPTKAGSRDLPTLIQAVREKEAEKEVERRRRKEEKAAQKAAQLTTTTYAEDAIREEEVKKYVTEEFAREEAETLRANTPRHEDDGIGK